jgi:hypothetical protein
MSGIYCEYTLRIGYNGKIYEYWGYENQNVKYKNYNGGETDRVIAIFKRVLNHYLNWIKEGRQTSIMLYELMDTIQDWNTITDAFYWNEYDIIRDNNGRETGVIVGDTIVGTEWIFTIHKWNGICDKGIRFIKQTKKQMEQNVINAVKSRRNVWELINEPNGHRSKENQPLMAVEPNTANIQNISIGVF